MKKQLLLFALLALFVNAFAQKSFHDLIRNNKGLSSHFIALDIADRVAFDANNLKLILGLNENSNLVLLNSEKDQLGYVHYRYYQTYMNIPVENSMYIIHSKDNLIVGMSGSIVFDFDANIAANMNSKLNSNDAISKATSFVGAQKYKWQYSGIEKHLKGIMNDESATYYPKPVKVWYNAGDEINPRALRLTYKINIYATEPLSRADIFVDAQTGEVIGKKDRIETTDATGTCNTAYSGTQTIHSDLSGANYRLRDYTKGSGVLTYKSGGADYTSSSSTWNLTGQDQYGLDAHYGASSTYTYFLNVHGRNSVNNAGLALISYVNETQTSNNAYWDGSSMHYGNLSSNGNGITGIDVCGHELTHGVTQYTCNLNYSYQSGAMNESMSDIFGKCVQFYTKPADVNWKLSNDMNWFIRDMANPNAYSQPDTYLGSYWATGSGDNGGVHTNSGVGNFMFYLLVTGGSGTNDIGSVYTVSGIGQSAAEKIIYRTETVYLTATSQYADWRTACISAATDLYGSTSNEVTQVQNAWYAVGIGTAGGGSTCSTATGLNASLITSSSATLNWSAVSGATSYNVQYRIVGNATWTSTTSTTTSKAITGLTSSSQYEFQIQTVCSGGTSAFTTSSNFTTLSANGSPVWCASNGNSTAYEYIDYVNIGSISRTSGADAGGYYNGSATSTAVTQGSSYTLTFSAGFASTVYSESWAVYIDWNYDGDFADANETAGTFTSTGSGNNTLTIAVPATATVALTRMRVSMHYNGTPASCGSFDYGEVEDYSLNVSASTGCGLPSGLNATAITSTTATLNWTAGSGAISYNVQYRVVGNATWTATTSTTTSKTITALTANSQYEFQIQTVCS
ncbi:MAG: M4 family metallopeptidase, partial [Chitinophagales bacterium]|nr:M4 family metallopeptidase [Chitinophagales bacterium]